MADKALRQSCRKSGQGGREGTGADTDIIGSSMLLKQSIFTLAVEQITVDECLLEGYGPAVTSFSVFCSSSEQNFSQELCTTTFHTFRHSSLLNTSLKGFNLFLFKIMLFLSHQNPCLCQIQLVLSLSNSAASQKQGLLLLLLR